MGALLFVSDTVKVVEPPAITPPDPRTGRPLTKAQLAKPLARTPKRKREADARPPPLVPPTHFSQREAETRNRRERTAREKQSREKELLKERPGVLFAGRTRDELLELLEYATDDERRLIVDALEQELSARAAWSPLPHQVAPAGDWRYWLLLAGRGAGKTDAGAFWFDQMMASKPGLRGRIIAPTLGDAREACVEGASGLLVHNPQVEFNRSNFALVWPNGSRARLFGAHTPDDVERLRAGGNSHVDWYDEFAAWRHMEDAFIQADLGLRLGDVPKAFISTTPKPRAALKRLVELAEEPVEASGVVMVKASTYDNPHLAGRVKERFEEHYGGARIGRQELYAEILDDVEGALWQWELFERDGFRIDEAPALRRIVVAVDPSWGISGDECGIVVAGIGWDKRGYVLEDCSLRAPPSEWGARVKLAYEAHAADRILAEVNFQAEQVKLVMRTVDPKLSFKKMTASRNKVARAEPVVALYEQGKISHVGGGLAGLERQMCEWVPPAPGHRSDVSPDRVDALVWALTELMLTAGGPARISSVTRERLPSTGRLAVVRG